MEIINDFAAIQATRPVTAIALGTFDGVHVGHQRIIQRAVEISRRLSGTSMVFTSVNHPLSCIAPSRCPQSLTTSQEKAGLISHLEVDYLTQIEFTPGFMSISPEKFIALLHQKFEPKCIVIGSNYTFGHKGAGNIQTLRRLSRHYGYRLEIPDSVTMNEKMVSSTEIRRLISIGNLSGAEQMLTRPVQLTGYIQYVGKKWCSPKEYKFFVEVDDYMSVPCDGIYSVCVTTNNVRQTEGVLTRLTRSVSMKNGILRIEIQFLGSLNELFISQNGCFAKLAFGEIISDEMVSSDG